MKKGCNVFISPEYANIIALKIKKRVLELMKKNKLISILDSIDLIYEDDYEFFESDIKKNKALYKMSYDFYKEVESLLKIGCLVRDIEKGYVDMFSEINGKQYFLCWNVNENRVEHWHELNEECESRKKIVYNLDKENQKNMK